MLTFQNYFQQKVTRLPLDNISKIFRKILPIYWAFLTYMLLKPGSESTDYWFMFSGIDKAIHISIFMVLGFTFAVAFTRIRFWSFIQIMLIYSVLTEILQEEMALGRSMENLDLVADTIGVLLGYFLFKKIKNISF